ncbi:hypothetical protein F-VV57_0484 [Faustovirus]|nr:hypothetical protein F-VV57_0484 [Faustovirus]QJX73752.1 hypothetical protein F-VV63_0486 [Faustovirus]
MNQRCNYNWIHKMSLLGDLPRELIAEIAVIDVGAWRALYTANRAIWKALRPHTDRAKAAFATWVGVPVYARCQQLPNGWRHGQYIRDITMYRPGTPTGHETFTYRDNLLHGVGTLTINGFVERECHALQGNAHGHWRTWDSTTHQLNGHVELNHGKIVKVHLWEHRRWDNNLNKFIYEQPKDINFELKKYVL